MQRPMLYQGGGAKAARRLAILGCTGMLGSMLLRHFAEGDDFEVVGSVRSPADAAVLKERYPRAEFRQFDAAAASAADTHAVTDGAQWVINGIGLIKQRIRDEDARVVEEAIRVNSLFPLVLARIAEDRGFKVIQIATDCVFSGARGRYLESDAQDPLDVYGKTKSLGEVRSPAVHHLRCSVVGPERNPGVSLLNWFLGQPDGAAVDGYVNHVWNGVTALHFAKICRGIVVHDLALPAMQHLVPGGEITKERLLRLFAKAFGRGDVTVRPVEAKVGVHRGLATINPAGNSAIWQAAGYDQPPGIEQMILELAACQRARPVAA